MVMHKKLIYEIISRSVITWLMDGQEYGMMNTKYLMPTKEISGLVMMIWKVLKSR